MADIKIKGSMKLTNTYFVKKEEEKKYVKDAKIDLMVSVDDEIISDASSMADIIKSAMGDKVDEVLDDILDDSMDTVNHHKPPDVYEGRCFGKVTHSYPNKGFGFIAPSDGGENIYFSLYDVQHHELVKNMLYMHDVYFDKSTNFKGDCAVNITLA